MNSYMDGQTAQNDAQPTSQVLGISYCVPNVIENGCGVLLSGEQFLGTNAVFRLSFVDY